MHSPAIPSGEQTVHNPMPNRNIYETRTPDEVVKEMADFIEVVEEVLTRRPEMNQLVIREATDAVLGVAHSQIIPEEEKYGTVEGIFGLVKEVCERTGEDYESRKRGVLGEVCTYLALEQLQFRLTVAKDDEDRHHKLDLIAGTGAGVVFGIQTKAHSNTTDIIVERLSKKKDIAVGPIEELTEEQTSEAAITSYKLRQYTLTKNSGFLKTHPEFRGQTIIPLIVRVPQSSRGIISHDKIGRPKSAFITDLYQKIENIMGWDKEDY